MQVQGFLADSVQAAGGKLSALGIGWAVLSVQQLPARHDRVGIGLIVTFEPEEAGRRRLELRLLDPEGRDRPLGRDASGGELRALAFPFDTGPGGERTATVAINLDGLVFDAEGPHTLVVSVDGLEARRLPFRVQRTPAPPMTEQRSGTYL